MAAPARYEPRNVSERKPGPWDDCTLCALATAVSGATHGRQRPTRAAMRAASGVVDRVAYADATNLNDAARALGRLPAPARTMRLERPQYGLRITWPQYLDRLRAGDYSVAQGLMALAPDRLKRHDRAFASRGLKSGHAVTVYDRSHGDLDLRWVDPLAPEGDPGETITQAELRQYVDTFAFGDGFLFVGLLEPLAPEPEPEPARPGTPPKGTAMRWANAAGYGTDALHLRLDVPAGTPVHELTLGPAWTHLRSATSLVAGGLADGRSGYFLVVVNTARFTPGQGRDVWQVVHAPGRKLRPATPDELLED